MPLITRRSSTRSTPRTSVGRWGLIRDHCSSLSQNKFLRTIPIPFKFESKSYCQCAELMSSDPSSQNEREQTQHSNEREPARDQGARHPTHGKTPEPRRPPSGQVVQFRPSFFGMKWDGNEESAERICDEARGSPLSLRLPDSSACVVAGRISVFGLARSRINAEQA
jgi:hypothetical protein